MGEGSDLLREFSGLMWNFFNLTYLLSCGVLTYLPSFMPRLVVTQEMLLGASC